MIGGVRILGMVALALLAVGGISAQLAQAKFKAASYPAKIEGSQINGKMVFASLAAELACNSSLLDGELTGASSSLVLSARTEGCSTGGGAVVMAATMNGCTYRFTQGGEISKDKWSAALAIQCPVGQAIVWENAKATCVAKTPPQEVPVTVSFENKTTAEPAQTVVLATNASGIHYTLEKAAGCFGSPSPGTYTNGAYVGTAEFTAEDPKTSEPLDLWLE